MKGRFTSSTPKSHRILRFSAQRWISMSLPPRPKYQGASRKLLLAFDIGTTFSGVSYSILDPKKVSEIRPVTRYPSQEHVGGDSKIPTVIYYDEEGMLCAIGAETLKDGIEEDAEEKNWSKAYWFKLHLRPKTNATMADGDEIPALPPDKTVVQVFTDYMRYLHQCAKDYISETHGALFWKSLENEILRVVATFFEPSVACIIEAIKLQTRTAHFPIESVFLVGGFSASNWLFERVRDAIQPLGIGVFRPDDHVGFSAPGGEIIYSYRGANPNPEWFLDEPDQYTVECTVKADTSMVKPEKRLSYTDGRLRKYYQIDYDIVLLFGLTELKAQIAYMENGVEKRGPAAVIYDDDGSADCRSP
ncbi:hypothetical protein EST38_g134 [Candolleomyces aberdarensis]|uniref:Uncharacterized protein n=1 Tax=Candolleomyces aberdarensis TaxID=2316362 RepID=A0A4V1Q5I1_9AGAR|nr:hypothetical protein EST38_g134 [Candolleomyces aberdarensis]